LNNKKLAEDLEKEREEKEAKKVANKPNEYSHKNLLFASDFLPALTILPKLMNTQMVALLNGKAHLSEAALTGFMGFHHLLLSILNRFPSLQKIVEKQLANFLLGEENRSKKQIPNLGEFMCLICVSKKFTWADFAEPIMLETLARSASWSLDKYPKYLPEPNLNAVDRAALMWKSRIVASRITAFQVFFVRKFANDLETQFKYYEQFKGVPTKFEIEELSAQTKSILKMSSWNDLFIRSGLQPLPVADLGQLLFDSCKVAVKMEYVPLWKVVEQDWDFILPPGMSFKQAFLKCGKGMNNDAISMKGKGKGKKGKGKGKKGGFGNNGGFSGQAGVSALSFFGRPFPKKEEELKIDWTKLRCATNKSAFEMFEEYKKERDANRARDEDESDSDSDVGF